MVVCVCVLIIQCDGVIIVCIADVCVVWVCCCCVLCF